MIPRLCHIPPGEFIMGGELKDGFKNESPPRKIYLDGFFIDETPVTCSQYEIFVRWIQETNDHSMCHPDEPLNKDHRPFMPYPDLFYLRDQPITGIDWFDAYAFAAWAGLRLPTEAEWEKAARSTDGRLWPWGNHSGFRNRKLQALYDDFGNKTENPRLAGVFDHPDGVSLYGCLDMAGNVWEMCIDYFDTMWYQQMPGVNPRNADIEDRVVIRGGCWAFNEHDAMCAIRLGVNKKSKWFLGKPIVGFRCASDVDDPVGAIGSMRHIKPGNQAELPGSNWSTITHHNGMPYYDGDEIDERGLFLGNGENASLNDFLILYYSPPQINWMKNFTDIDICTSIRNSVDFQIHSYEDVLARDIIAKAGDVEKENLADQLQRRLKPLMMLRSFDKPIKIDPAPLTSLNGFAKTNEDGTNIIVVHANVLRIHDRLGQSLSLLKEEKIAGNKLIPMMNELRKCVRSPDLFGVVPESPSTKGAFAFNYSRLFTTWLLAHEFGHIKLGHIENYFESCDSQWDLEFAADDFASQLVTETKEAKRIEGLYETALGFWLEFIRFCEDENQISITHPPMQQRIDRIRSRLEIEQQKDLATGLLVARSVCVESH